ncbi:MAG TPA: hypothetical protein VFB62_14750, partial [Polyangiaceae bacterium]|nr:hypothetical protein [Polyangiaceae bacterium]
MKSALPIPLRTLAEHLVAGLAALAVALHYGWDYGVDNQVIYLLGSLRVLDGQTLAHDWFTTTATHYHVAYGYLGAALIALSERGMAVAICAHVVVAAGLLALYAMLRALDARTALAAFLLVLCIVMVGDTRGAGATYVFDHILQPSTLASAGLLLGAAFFAHGRFFLSGACIAAAGMFHANFLLLLYGACVVAHVALGRASLLPRLAAQLALPTLVLLGQVPLILRAAGGGPEADAARDVWMQIRAPHHYAVTRFQWQLAAPMAGWLLVALGGLATLRRHAPVATLRAGAFIGGLVAVIWVGVAGAVLLQSRSLTLLFSWRIGPHATLLMQTVAAGAAVHIALGRGVRTPGAALGATLAGLGVLSLFHAGDKDKTFIYLVLGAAAAAAAVRVLGEVAAAIPPVRRLWTGVAPWLAAAGAAWFLLPHAVSGIEAATKRSTVLNGLRQQERELFSFMRDKTPRDAVFLTPPNAEAVRFHGRR